MSQPTSEPARGQRVDQASVPQVGLFSHTPTAEVAEQRHPLVGDRVDWRATPFSTRQHRTLALGEQAHPRRTDDNPPGRPMNDEQGTAGAT